MIIGSFEEEPIVIDADAAVARVDTALAFPFVVPEFFAGASIDGPGIIGHGEVENAVELQGCGFDFHAEGAARSAGVGLIAPS